MLFTESIKASKWAILISAGKATTDDEFSNSEYWYDLFLAYEDLIFKEGFKHSEIIVCYGDGESFDSTKYERYHRSRYNWDEIVDHDNDIETLKDIFRLIADSAKKGDHVVIRWVLGHGGDPYDGDVENQDDYWALIQNHNYNVPIDTLVKYIDLIDEQSQRLVFWMTCHSGCMLAGSKRVDNGSSLVITSSRWNTGSAGGPWGDTYHAEFNWWFTGYLYGQHPGPIGPIYLDADDNSDGYITMDELYNNTEASLTGSHPQIEGYDSSRTNTVVMGPIDLVLQDILVDEEENRIFEGPNSITAAGNSTYFITEDGGNCTMEAGNYISLLTGFKAQEGCDFLASINTSLKPSSSTTLIARSPLNIAEKKTSQDPVKTEKKETKEPIPTVFSCAQNYPNPFVGNTTIKYGLPKNCDNVNLTIFNLAGQAVRTLFNGQQQAGFKIARWDGRTDAGREVPKGIYFYVFKAEDDFIKKGKMIFVK